MTKLRPAGSVKQALMQCIGALGPDAPAAAGRSLRRLHEWSDPDEPSCLPMDVARRLDRAMRRAGHGTPLLDAYRLEVLRDELAPAGQSRALLLAALVAEVGDIAREQHAAEADGRVSAAERARMQAEIAQARAWLDQMHAAYADPPPETVAGGTVAGGTR
ncbi:MAG: hypothetical protein AB7P02_25195 [Alphaproteobacteria bacterium]